MVLRHVVDSGMAATTHTTYDKPGSRTGPTIYQRINQRLRDLRQFDGPDQGAIAEALQEQGHDIKQATVSKYERQPVLLANRSPAFAIAFMTAYGMPEEEATELTTELFLDHHADVFRFVLEHQEASAPAPTADTRYIPVYSHVGAGAGGEDGVILRYLELEPGELGDAAYEVNGQSMEPDIPHGSTVVIQRGVYELGDIVVAWVPTEGMVVKRLVLSRPEHRAVLASSNPDYAQLIDDDATIFGKVVEHRKRH